MKFQNISAVLVELGHPHLPGLKPQRNLQDALRVEVATFLAAHPTVWRDIKP